MTDVALSVEHVGLAVVQDLGRFGYARDGIPANGATDQHAARVANTLVGNSPTAPLIEATGSSLTFTTDGPLLMAVAGAAREIRIDSQTRPSWETLVVPAGSTVSVGMPATGQRNYIAFHGVLAPAEPRLLGSISPDPLLETGLALLSNDTVTVRTDFVEPRHPYFDQPVLRLGAERTRTSKPGVIDVLPGPDADEFETTLDGASFTFEISPQSDHVGLRLLGAVPARSKRSEILSRGVPVGAVEIPPRGGLLVLLRGRPVTAGYPVIAVAISVDIDRLAQLRAGDTVRFRTVDHEYAVARAKHQREELLALARRVETVLGSLGLSHLIQVGHLSQTRNRTRVSERGAL